VGPLTPADRYAVGVIGAGHSGTTIVYRMLAMHPDLTWFSQYSHRALLGPPPRRAAAEAMDRLLRRLFPHDDWTKVRYARGWRRMVPAPIEAHRIWKYLMSDEGTAPERIRSVFAAACAAATRPAITVKPPGRYRSGCAPVVSAAFPRSRYLHVARDGRAVALSVSQKWLKRGGGQREAVLRRGAEHWTRALRQIQQYEQTLPVAVIRYEALCADVHGQLRRALAFAEVDPDRFPYNRVPRTLRSTNEARTQAAAPGDLAALERLLADELRRYGYASDSP
jgi:hypothetical protein